MVGVGEMTAKGIWDCRVCGKSLAWSQPVAESCPQNCPLRQPYYNDETADQALTNPVPNSPGITHEL